MKKQEGILRVAAYCRVSTNEREQHNSYINQINYYTDYIASKPNWSLVSVFADEGISGTSVKNRQEFMKMFKLCRLGRIDLILCKSISRFARNTLDCLSYVRELRKLGVSVLFEKENINTGEENSEFMITLYAAFAQAESESISKNITWGIEKKYREGRVTYKLGCVLGYRLGPDGRPVIIESEAVHVRRIFSMFIEGRSMGYIANLMSAENVVRRNGSSSWSRKNVEQILKNEKYAGMAILQKTVTTDFITHTRSKNTGQKPMYVLKNIHEAIVSEDTFNEAKKMFEKRRLERLTQKAFSATRRTPARRMSFGPLLFCPCCTGSFRRVVRSYKGAKYALWRCASRLEGGPTRCPHGASIRESVLIDKLREYWNENLAETTGHPLPEDIGGFEWGLFIRRIEVGEEGMRILVK